MSFYSILREMGLSNILDPVRYESPILEGALKVYRYIDDILANNRRILIYGDYDTDGLMCVVNWRLFFEKLGFKNFDVFEYRLRTHSIDRKAIERAILEEFDYIIISDAGSNDIENLSILNNHGVKVILIDHHQTQYNYTDYPDDCAVVNTIIENRVNSNLYEPLVLSAGALVYVVLEPYLSIQGKSSVDLACYALVSLYADCIDMSKRLNRGIYYTAMQLKFNGLPMYIRHFKSEHTDFCRNFIEFHFTPKINSIFRSELFELLNDYILNPKEGKHSVDFVRRVEMINEIHLNSRNIVEKVSDLIRYEVYDNFVVGNLNSVERYFNIEDYKLYNHTGLIANKLADRLGLSAVVLCFDGKGIKGSFRDHCNRDYLKIFKQFSNSNGHASAFGIHISPYRFNEFLDNIKFIDKKFHINTIGNQPIIINQEEREPDYELINDIAKYNEFAGNNIPIALITKRIEPDMKEIRTPYKTYKYKWYKLTIQSTCRLQIGAVVKCKPILNKYLKLTVI